MCGCFVCLEELESLVVSVTDSNNPPEFYKAYVSEIQARVARDADLVPTSQIYRHQLPLIVTLRSSKILVPYRLFF